MSEPPLTRWQRFWHRPVRAERLALVRIAFGIALLADQLFEYIPYLDVIYGPGGFAPQGWLDYIAAGTWRWTILFFNTDDMTVVRWCFGLWMGATALMLAGCFTRLAAIGTWLGLLAFLARNPMLKNGGDDVLGIALFLLMLAPCGKVWSVDHWRRRRRAKKRNEEDRFDADSRWIAPWSVRLFQIDLSMIYFTTALAKLGGETWRAGLSVHYVLQDVTISRWPYAQFPLPLWLTGALTYATLAFELLFPILVWPKRTRGAMLLGGVLFHVGIFLTMEIGWFSFYTIALYGAWIPDEFWRRYFGPGRAHGGRDDEAETVEAPPEDYLVFFDTLCPICRKSRRTLERLDWGGRLIFRDIHDRENMAREAPGIPYSRALREIIVATPVVRWPATLVYGRGRRILGGFEALRRTAWTLPALWPLLPVMYIPGVRPAARVVYRWVAKNRYRLVHCDDGTCDLHLRALAKANLDEREIAEIVARARGKR